MIITYFVNNNFLMKKGKMLDEKTETSQKKILKLTIHFSGYLL